MKNFQYCFSNPPYQKQVAGDSSSVTNIFHEFQALGFKIADVTMMIYPGGRWLHKSGRGLKEFSETILSSTNLATVDYYSEKYVIRNIFPSTSIRDGVTIVKMDKKYNKNYFLMNGAKVEKNIKTIPPIGSPETMRTINKLEKEYLPLEHRTAYQNRVKVNVDKAADDSRIVAFNKDDFIDYDTHSKIFINDVSGVNGRTKLFVMPNDLILSGLENLPYWKVYTNTLQGREEPGDIKFDYVDDHTIVSYSRILFALVNSEEEAQNMVKYLHTRVVQELLCAAVKSRNRVGTNMALFVPDLNDYSHTNDIFKDDTQLGEEHEYYGLTVDERIAKLFNL